MAAVFAIPAAGISGLLHAEEGLNVTFGVSQRVESVERSGSASNKNEGIRSLTNLDFGLMSESNYQSLSLQARTGLAYNFDESSGFDTEDSSARLNYRLDSRSSQLTFGASVLHSDVDDNIILLDDLGNEFIVADSGTRTNYTLRSGLVLGRDGPVSTDLKYAFGRSMYSGVTDPGLNDSTTHSINARVNFRLSPVASANVFANWRDIDQEGATGNDRVTQSFGVGGSYDVSAITNLTAQISFDQNESQRPGSSNTNDGLGYSLGLNHERPNGAYRLSFSGSETINGTRNQFQVTRGLELRRGRASIGVGGTKTEGFSVQPRVNATLQLDLNQSSKFDLNLSQSSTVNNNDEETIRTKLGVDYRYELNSLSSLSAGLELADQNVLGGMGEDETVVKLRLTYRREVADEWNLISGYNYSTVRRESEADRNISTIFVGLEKTFSFRP